ALMRISLPSPDVVVVLADANGELVLQALDFKWDLEFASYDQIRASALRAIFERDQGVLGAAISAASAAGPSGACIDGLLFSPDSPANARFLSSSVNQRQEYPIEAREVILEPVDPEPFFAPLPGWDMALRLAALDRSEHSMQSTEEAEHYYRLGAGLLGAVTQLCSSVFETDPVAADASMAIAWLESQVRAVSTSVLVGHVERLMLAKARHTARLRRLTKSPYRWGDLAQALASKGIVLPGAALEGDSSPERERWRDVIKRVGVEHRAAVLRAGLRLTHQGLSDADALAQLELESSRFRAMARVAGTRFVSALLDAPA
ncbi:MAG: hypothetical protein M1482_06835, partial [Chloroflexi bacterium]|nr:hypothetical protein [Chloroflexota bacterium]